MTDEKPIQALGGKHNESAIVQEEIARWKALSKAIMALMPINSAEKAAQYRSILVEHASEKGQKALKKCMDELQLSY